MRVHTFTLRAGISRTKEFEKKGLVQFATIVGTKCGHGCLYCSTGACSAAAASELEGGADE